MVIVVIIIMFLVCLSLMLKLTYLPLYGKLMICLLSALFIGLEWETATGQSKTQIADWLQNPELMLDIAVLLTIDVAIQIAFCKINAKSLVGEKLSKCERIIRQATLWIPGILIFPTLFALLVEVIFSFPGVNFSTIAWSLAVIVFIIVASLPTLIKWIIPECDLRLELIFMLNAMIALLGVVVTVNGRTAVTHEETVEWAPLIGVIIIFTVGMLAGLLLFKYSNNKKISNIK